MRSTLLKILSTLAFAAVVFPFWFSLDISAFEGIGLHRMLYYYAVGIIPFMLGFIGSKAVKAHKKLKIPIRAAGLLTFGAGFLGYLIGGNGLTLFYLGTGCIFLYFVGERFGYKNFADMFPMSAFGFYIFLMLGCYIAVVLTAPEEYSRAAGDTLIIAFALEFTAAALLINQSGIYDRANMRKETRSTLPKGLSAYNAALVLGMTVTGLVLCVFREQIAWFLSQCVLAVIRAIVWLISLFHAESMPLEASEGGELGSGWITESPIMYVAEALGVTALVVLIIVFRHRIFAAIKAFFARLGAWFSGRPEESDKPEFTDVFEDLSRSRRRTETESIYAVRRAYKAESDPRGKFRLGYRILLYRIKAFDQRLVPADTVTVQAQRGAEHFGEEEMHSTANVYESIRYGSAVPTAEQLSSLGELIDK